VSRTDSTRPYWVQIQDPQFPWGLRVWHWHYHSHHCEPQFPLPPTRREGKRTLRRGGCEFWPKYESHDKLYGRSRWRRRHPGQEGRARAALRLARADWLKTAPGDRQDIDSMVDAPTQRWLWAHWYWD
jgi:hypothetical protein